MSDSLVFQHYQVLTRDDGKPWELGRGAMGITYKAVDTNLRVSVALKVIHPHQLHSDVAAQRFVREARAAARLRHPNIASVFHLGCDRGTWFYAMEFIDGETAEAVVKRSGPLPERQALELTAQVAKALSAGEAHALVHRDIKPANIMLIRDGDEWVVKVIDFGLARSFAESKTDEDLATVTHGGFLGTPYFASPEQLEQHEVDLRSDVYSLGITLWYLLTGKTPFSGPMLSVMNQHLHRPPPIERLAGIAGEATERLLLRMLEKDPAKRQQSASELRREIEQCLESSSLDDYPTLVARDGPRESSALADTVSSTGSKVPPLTESALGTWPARYEVLKVVRRQPYGLIAQARERSTAQTVQLIRLNPEISENQEAFSRLRQVVDASQTIVDSHVLRIVSLERSDRETQIATEWIDSFSWQDLLRARGSLLAEETCLLATQAAEGAEAIIAAGIERPQISLADLTCLASSLGGDSDVWKTRPLAEWSGLQVKVSPLGLLPELAQSLTVSDEATFVPPPRQPDAAASATEAVKALAGVVYELLGGSAFAGTESAWHPLGVLSEGSNAVLQRALVEPERFGGPRDFVERLRAGEDVPSSAEPIASAIGLADTFVPQVSESVMPSVLGSPTEANSAFKPEVYPARRFPWGIAAALAIALVIGFSAIKWGPNRRSLSTTQKSPVEATPASAATPVVVERKFTATELRQEAERLQAMGKWKDAAVTWLRLQREFPETRGAAKLGLELLFREVRWRYTPRSDQPVEISRAQVESLRAEAEQAVDLEVPAAMMLLGQHETESDWKRAIDWYEKARPLAPKAAVRVALVLAKRDSSPEGLALAWQRLQEAAEAGDLDGRVTVAESYFNGDINGRPVAGLAEDKKRGVEMLRGVITSAVNFGDAMPFKASEKPETYVTQPTRSKLLLGSYYFYFENLPESERPDWYRIEAKTMNHAQEMVQLLREASADWPEAEGLLGVAAAQGLGMERSDDEATRHFKQAIKRGDLNSLFNYAMHLKNKVPGGPLPPEARKHLIQAAEKNHRSAIKYCQENDIPFRKASGE
jgi:TPR repeat protein